MSRYEQNNPKEGYEKNDMGSNGNRTKMRYSDNGDGEMPSQKYSGNRSQRGYGNQRPEGRQQRPEGRQQRPDGRRESMYGEEDQRGSEEAVDHDGDHEGDHDDYKHGSSGGHKAVNIILIIIIVLLVVAIVFCILYLTNAWKPSFMKTIFGDNEKFTHKPKASSCSAGVCGYGDKLTDDEKAKRKRKRRSRKIKE